MSEKSKSGIARRGKAWTDEARAAGINAYLAAGTLSAASGMTGIPITTLHDWLRDPANEQIIDEAKRIHARRASVDAGAVWQLATAALTERLEEGDWRVSPKGDAIRLPVSARDLAFIADRMATKAKEWAEIAHGGTAPVDLSPEKAEALAREILRIDRELQRRNTVDVSPPAGQAGQAGQDQTLLKQVSDELVR